MAKNTVNLSSLSAEQKAALLEELKQEEQQKEQQLKDGRKAYKQTVNETIPKLFLDLVQAAQVLSSVKKRCFEDLKGLVTSKAELYGKEEQQYSHSFTTDKGLTIMIGRRYNDGWDDTVTAGINKVKAFLESLGKDANSKALVKTVLQLLSQGKAESLKASRVLQLKRLAEDVNNPEFTDAINIISDAYRPVFTKEFVTARYKDKQGKTVDLPLDITAVDFDFEFDVHEEQKTA